MRHESLLGRCFLFSTALLLSVAARAAIDMDTAGQIYEAAGIREQVRPSLKALPKRMRDMFAVGSKTALTTAQGDALEEAATHGFTVSVFEPQALSALAENLDPADAKKALTFLKSDVGLRMVAADKSLAALDEPSIDGVMTGTLKAPSTPQRDQLFEKLERAARSSESTVHIFSSMSDAVAIGTAIGVGTDPLAAADKTRKGDDGQAEMANNMRESLRRYMAYGYRDLSVPDLKAILAYLESKPGMRYVNAYTSAMAAGFNAMGQRAGEQIGGALRELAQSQAQNPSPPASPAPSLKKKPLQDTPLPETTSPPSVLPPKPETPESNGSKPASPKPPAESPTQKP